MDVKYAAKLYLEQDMFATSILLHKEEFVGIQE